MYLGWQTAVVQARLDGKYDRLHREKPKDLDLRTRQKIGLDNRCRAVCHESLSTLACDYRASLPLSVGPAPS